MSKLNLTGQKIITARDLEVAAASRPDEIEVDACAVVTPAARDLVQARGIKLTRASAAAKDSPIPPAGARPPEGRPSSRPSAPTSEYDRLLHSKEAQALKEEIVHNARKLWQREYVDGNGGNLSCRLTADTVICTPTLVSKADCTVDDLCLVDMDGNQLAGKQKRTSEVFLHLEIYKAVPQAKAVVHAHPPHATAYAIVGRVPPNCVIPEHEVFVGNVAITQYETPGTKRFAETVLPFVKNHNTILLGNHGVVSWADTVTHAEWYHEVVDTYCRTLMLAAQLGQPIVRIPAEKTKDLLAVKKRLGLPDPRLEMQECQLCDAPEFPQGITACPAGSGCGEKCRVDSQSPPDVEALVRAVTDEVMKALGEEK
jgi:L-fuculose-phosphate aldolase